MEEQAGIKEVNASSITTPEHTESHTEDDRHIIPQPATKGWRVPHDGSSNDSRCSRRKFLIFVALVFVVLGAVIVVVTTVRLVKQGKEGASDPQSNTTQFSLFKNPATVKWKLKGQVIHDPQNAEPGVIENHFDGDVDMSADATALAVRITPRLYALYYYNETSKQWYEHTRWEYPESEFFLLLRMAGNGKRLAISGYNGVRTFDYLASSDTWKERGQAIIELQEQDSTGSSFDFNYDGSILAVGSPYHDGQDINSGIVRVYERTPGETWKLQDRVLGTRITDNVGGRVRLSANGLALVSCNWFRDAFSGACWVWRRRTERDNQWVLAGSPFVGSSPNGRFGWDAAVSNDGNVVAFYTPNYQMSGTSAVLVYEFKEASQEGVDTNPEEWVLRGQVIEIPLNAAGRLCLGANGNILVVGIPDTEIKVFQFDSKTDLWVRVGSSFEAGDEEAVFGTRVSCASDGRTFATGRDSLVERGAVAVWEAVEDEE